VSPTTCPFGLSPMISVLLPYPQPWGGEAHIGFQGRRCEDGGHSPPPMSQPMPGVHRCRSRSTRACGMADLLQDLGFPAVTLPKVDILMATKQPRGQELTREQHLANQALHQRRRRIEHVNSSVKRFRVVKDRLRLWKQGVRDLVMEICCALHNFRVRLTPW